MTPRMTPERRAEIDAILTVSGSDENCDTRFEWRLVQALRDSVAEIDALTAELAAKDKALDQAIELYGIHGVGGKANRPKYPELAAELRKREGQ